MNQLSRLEKYTLKRSAEVLVIEVEVDGVPDQVMVFKGFSSSLMRPTAFDPDVPVLPENAVIIQIDRLQSPYSPEAPRYIQQGLTWDRFQPLLDQVGV
ncbi:MAG: hypothetical protein IGS48_01195 [Oscillatoriales cyanobacterium C42_A2020_001]|nr:hypothetical protein [Leptolyngbyaceae cyanobacterium C42_A2020_001]